MFILTYSVINVPFVMQMTIFVVLVSVLDTFFVWV